WKASFLSARDADTLSMLWVVMSWLWRLFLSVDVNAVLTQDPTPEVSSSLPESSSVISVTLNIRFLSGRLWTLRSRQRPTCSRVGRTGASGALDCGLKVVVEHLPGFCG